MQHLVTKGKANEFCRFSEEIRRRVTLFNGRTMYFINANLKIDNMIKNNIQFEHVRNKACFLTCNTKYAIT